MNPSHRTKDMNAFGIIWFGQVISLLGTAMSEFGLTLWAYEKTGKATPLAMIMFFYVVPQVVLSPFIGVLVDRGNRKLMMMLSDLAAAIASTVVLTLFLSDTLQIWHLFATSLFFGIFQGFQWPAYSASISLMLPKEQYTRANSMLSVASGASQVLAPFIAGALIGRIGLNGILLIDISAAVFAIAALLLVHIPQPEKSMQLEEKTPSFWHELTYGFRYIFSRPSLLGLQTVFLVGNFFSAMAFTVIAPLILGRSGNNQMLFGSVQSISAIGGVIGGVAMSIWGGPKRRMHGVLFGWMLSSLLGQFILGLGRSMFVWALGGFLWGIFDPLINGCNQAIWQAKVDPGVQGRVFTARMFIAWMVIPISNLIAGPLVDRVLEPGMQSSGVLYPYFHWLVGSGTGAGAALLFIIGGLLAAAVGLSAFFFPAVRNAEDMLLDHGSVIHSRQDAV